MSFASPFFALALAVLVLLVRAPLSWRSRKVGLLVGSYLIYGSWDARFLVPLLASTCLDWHCSHRIAASHGSTRRAWLALSLAVNLGLLVTFRVALALGWTDPIVGSGWFFPLGISFYTFQTLSYTVDVYRRDLEPAESFLDFALFVGFFPQLLAGPIVRARSFLPQLRLARRATGRDLTWGAALFVMGLFLKVVLADYLLGPAVDRVLATLGRGTTFEVWVAAVGFFVQLYLDFAGYSLCAVGAARCLGFELPRNFFAPLSAPNASEFWGRWHMTLTTWVRDYVFSPLSATRLGRWLGPGSCALVCLTLIGLWHGPGLVAVLWGVACGLQLAAEISWGRRSGRGIPLPSPVKAGLLTLYFAPFVYLLRGPSGAEAYAFYSGLAGYGVGAGVLSTNRTAGLIAVITGTILANHALRGRTLTQFAALVPGRLQAPLLAAALVLVLVASGGEGQDLFLYFDF